MEYGVLLVAVLIVAYILRHDNKNRLIPATSADWFVVFDIDAEKKILVLWFYPIIGFRRVEDYTIAITSRPSYTTKLASIRPTKRIGDDLWNFSLSYGRWVRDGVLCDEKGNPELNRSDFSSTVESYLLRDFKLHLGTPVPRFYQELLKNAVVRTKKS